MVSISLPSFPADICHLFTIAYYCGGSKLNDWTPVDPYLSSFCRKRCSKPSPHVSSAVSPWLVSQHPCDEATSWGCTSWGFLRLSQGGWSVPQTMSSSSRSDQASWICTGNGWHKLIKTRNLYNDTLYSIYTLYRDDHEAG